MFLGLVSLCHWSSVLVTLSSLKLRTQSFFACVLFYSFLFYIGVQLINDVVFVLGVEQSHLVIHIHVILNTWRQFSKEISKYIHNPFQVLHRGVFLCPACLKLCFTWLCIRDKKVTRCKFAVLNKPDEKHMVIAQWKMRRAQALKPWESEFKSNSARS